MKTGTNTKKVVFNLNMNILRKLQGTTLCFCSQKKELIIEAINSAPTAGNYLRQIAG